MKELLIKSCFMLSLAWFAFTVIMIVVGCVSNAFGCSEGLFCGAYPALGVALFVLFTGAFVAYFVKCCACLRNKKS